MSSATSRRDFLQRAAMFPAAVTPLLALFESFPALAADTSDGLTGVPVQGFRPSLLPTQDQIWQWAQLLNTEMGPQRYTANANHTKYVEWLATQFGALGYAIQRDHYTLKAWEAPMGWEAGLTNATRCSLFLTPSAGAPAIELELLHYYPFAGSTLTSGPVTGPFVFLPRLFLATGAEDTRSAMKQAAALAANPPPGLSDMIVVVESPCAPLPAYTFWGEYPADLKPFPDTPFGGGQFLNGSSGVYTALDGKCKGIVFCYTNLSDDNARYQHMPFGGAHRQTPGLFVGKQTALLLQSVGAGATLTMHLPAVLTPNAPTDTIIATLPGVSDEVVLVTTHTDGPNLTEEIGGVALLAMASYAAKVPLAQRKRTLVFSLVTGHFSSGALSDKTSATGPNGQVGVGAGTAGVLRDHPEITAKVVAGMAVEHLGCMEWLDNAAATQYSASGAPEFDMFFVGNTAYAPNVAFEVMSAGQGEPPSLMRMGAGKTGTAFGESGAIRSRGLPTIGVIPNPNYLCAAPADGEISKLRPERLYTQIRTVTKLMRLLDVLSTDQLKGLATVSAADQLLPEALGCSDLSAAKAAMGTRVGDARFNPVADVDHNGVIDIRDVSAIGREVPAGTVCR